MPSRTTQRLSRRPLLREERLNMVEKWVLLWYILRFLNYNFHCYIKFDLVDLQKLCVVYISHPNISMWYGITFFNYQHFINFYKNTAWSLFQKYSTFGWGKVNCLSKGLTAKLSSKYCILPGTTHSDPVVPPFLGAFQGGLFGNEVQMNVMFCKKFSHHSNRVFMQPHFQLQEEQKIAKIHVWWVGSLMKYRGMLSLTIKVWIKCEQWVSV